MKHSLLLFLIFLQTAVAQTPKYPQIEVAPLDIPLDLSATFGELRNNHFHSGIDFKTQQKEGLNVLATESGFVSRIKISIFGYGKAIYITHPNGYTSVYGHIQKFAPKIEEYIKKKQYEKKSYEIELFPKASELPVTQAELIAFSGNSGSSGGPHLHFEYRDTKTEFTINPFYFGLDKKVADTKAPIINQLVAYPQNDNSSVNRSQLSVEIPLIPQKDGSYIASPVTAKNSIGFGINAYDIANASYNQNGLYQVQSFLNGEKVFEYTFDQFSFDETRYINAFIDYKRFIEKDNRIQKLFTDNNIKLSLIKHQKNNGLIEIQPNLNYNYRIEISDFHGNKTTIYVPITYETEALKITKPTEAPKGYLIKSKIDNHLAFEKATVYMPANSFYQDFYLQAEASDSTFQLHNPTVPIHKNITLSFDVSQLKAEKLKGIFIAEKSGKKLNYIASTLKKKQLSAKIRNFGTFQMAQDTIAPQVKLISLKEGERLVDKKTITVQIKDDLSCIATFNGYLNDQWILLEYDFKTNTLTYEVNPQAILPDKNFLKLVVTDNLGNSTTLETYFLK